MLEKSIYLAAPYFILGNKELRLGTRLVLCEVMSLARQNGYCFAGNKYLAGKLGISERQVSEALTTLKQLGLISAKNPHTHERQLIPDYRKLQSMQKTYDANAKSAAPERKKRGTGTTQSAHYNNKNNKNNKENYNSPYSVLSYDYMNSHKASYDIHELEIIR